MDAINGSIGCLSTALDHVPNAGQGSQIKLINCTNQDIRIDENRRFYLNGRVIRQLSKIACKATGYFYNNCSEVLVVAIENTKAKFNHHMVFKLNWTKCKRDLLTNASGVVQPLPLISNVDQLPGLCAMQRVMSSNFFRKDVFINKQINRLPSQNIFNAQPQVTSYRHPTLKGKEDKITILNCTHLNISVDVGLRLKINRTPLLCIENATTWLAYYPNDRTDIVCFEESNWQKQIPLRYYCKVDYELLHPKKHFGTYIAVEQHKAFYFWQGNLDRNSPLHRRRFPLDVLKGILLKYLYNL